VADVLAPEICFLQLYKLCADMLSSKLASGKVEGCAYGTKRRLGWVTGLIVSLRGGRLLKMILVRRIRLGEWVHGQDQEGDEDVGLSSD
jgi:hypothetical protein